MRALRLVLYILVSAVPHQETVQLYLSPVMIHSPHPTAEGVFAGWVARATITVRTHKQRLELL
jgi:hypothetical protein